MRIDVFTLFPDIVTAYAETSVLGRAQQAGALEVVAHDLRDGATDARHTVDDAPFGGGAGMVLMPEPVFAAVEAVEATEPMHRPLFFLSPTGRTFTQEVAAELAQLEGFSLLCGRYEGADQRIIDELCDGEISLGDVVLAGGELAALVVVEAVGRLLPGALGNASSTTDESFSDGLLEYPQYTRPAEFRGLEVPAVLRSGNHGEVERWRRAQSLHRTLLRRPDLIDRRGGLSEEELQLLAAFGLEEVIGDETSSKSG
jgi:tRNA (guanine37-N1)-methyltransferase